MEEKEEKFEFQTYMQEHGIKRKKLPKLLRRMVKVFEDHLDEVTANCDQEYCIEIRKEFQDEADFIMDKIFEFVEEQAAEIENEEDSQDQKEDEEVIQEAPKPTDEEILAELYTNNQLEVTRKELKELGFSTPFKSKEMIIGSYKLCRPLMHSMWMLSQLQKQGG